MSIPPQVIEAAGKAGKIIVATVGPAALKKGLDYLNTDHGSNVKRGAFHECSIEMFGDKACIVVDEDTGQIVMLTSDTIQSYKYVKEKKSSRLNLPYLLLLRYCFQGWQ